MKVAQGLAGDFTIAFRLELAAASRWPMVSEYGPRPIFARLKIYLEYLACGRAAHDDMLEALVRRRTEQFRSEYESNVDAALIGRVEVYERVVPVRECRDSSDQHLQHSGILQLAYPQKVRSQPATELPNDRRELIELAIPKLRSPVHEIAPNCSLELVGPWSITMIEQVLQVPPRQVVSGRHFRQAPIVSRWVIRLSRLLYPPLRLGTNSSFRKMPQSFRC